MALTLIPHTHKGPYCLEQSPTRHAVTDGDDIQLNKIRATVKPSNEGKRKLVQHQRAGGLPKQL